MRLYLAIALALIATVGSGLAHGILTDRWGVPETVHVAAARLDNVPATIPGWTSTPQEMSDRILEQAGAVGYLARAYVHNQTGAQVQVTVLCGRPGPLATHPPTVCFVNAGMKQLRPAQPILIERGDDHTAAEFQITDFDPPETASTSRTRTLWSWSPDGRHWSAPENSRLEFAKHPHLYKLYILNTTLPEKDEEQLSPDVEQFTRQFLEQLEAAVADNNNA
ncbi:MAG: exosortase-associated EpsI family protein [Maioricimonas sp. JB049]